MSHNYGITLGYGDDGYGEAKFQIEITHKKENIFMWWETGTLEKYFKLKLIHEKIDELKQKPDFIYINGVELKE